MLEENWIDKATAEHLVELNRQRESMLSRVGINIERQGSTQNGRRSAMVNIHRGNDFYESNKLLLVC